MPDGKAGAQQQERPGQRLQGPLRFDLMSGYGEGGQRQNKNHHAADLRPQRCGVRQGEPRQLTREKG